MAQASFGPRNAVLYLEYLPPFCTLAESPVQSWVIYLACCIQQYKPFSKYLFLDRILLLDEP
jgi:hypothetical protein